MNEVGGCTSSVQDRVASNPTCLAVYVGKAASLSFLQLLRDTVTQHIGPSQFSHNFSEDMLETEAHHDPLNFSEESCSIDEKRRFIQIFFTVVRRFRSDDLCGSSIDHLARPAAFSILIATRMICSPPRPSPRPTGRKRAPPSRIS